MAVTVDATGTPAITSPSTVGTPISYTGMTVGAGNALLAVIVFPGIGNGNAPTGLTSTWDQGGTNQTMSLLGAMPSDQGCYIAFFGLLAPTPGNKTMSVAWTGGISLTAVQSTICAISFNGVLQTSINAAFPSESTSTGSSAAPSITVTSGVGHIAVGATAVNAAAGSLGSENQTRLYLDQNSSQDNGSQYANGSPTITLTWAVSPTEAWDTIGVDVAPSLPLSIPLGVVGLAQNEW